MTNEDGDRWTRLTIFGLVTSITCMLPTAVTVLIVFASIFVPLATTGLLATSGVEPRAAGESGGALLAMATAASMVASLPVSVASVLMHPVGAITAGLAYREGARRSGLALLLAHTITFAAGAFVALTWSSFIVGMLVD